jgi:hypothetical protein
MHAAHTSMGGLKRSRSGVDAVEHALQGVHTSENHERIVSFETSRGRIGTRLRVEVDVVDDPPSEREVIVHLPETARSRLR